MARTKKELFEDVDSNPYLDASELRTYETFHLKKQVEELKTALLHSEAKYHTLSKECAELRIKLTGHLLGDRRRELDNLVTEHKKFNAGVRERLNIESEVFGYHPETGEISLSK